MALPQRRTVEEPTDLALSGPSAWDMARSFRSVRSDPLSFLTRVQEQYGDVVAFPVPGAPVLLVNDPADVRHVLQTSARRWNKQTVQYAALARITGPGLLATAEPTWMRHRRAAAPAFHHQRLLAVSEQVRQAADDSLDGLPDLSGAMEVDVSALTHRIALDAVGRALFSSDLSGQAQPLLEASSQAAELVVRLGRSIVPTASWLPTLTNLRVRTARRRLAAISMELIGRRRDRSTEHAAASHGEDLLGLLLDSGIDDDQVCDELVTMIIAGHETVATALTWTLMLLAEEGRVQESVRSELAAQDAPPSLLDYGESLPWTRAVIDEALRLYPPAWVISRRAEAADVICDRIVPAGTMVIVSPWLLHRRGDIWDEPSAFRPERFLGRDAGQAVSYPGYLPFGQGPRLCIGRAFALGEMVVVLSRLLGRYRLSVTSAWQRPQPQARVALQPRNGMSLVLTRLPRVADG